MTLTKAKNGALVFPAMVVAAVALMAVITTLIPGLGEILAWRRDLPWFSRLPGVLTGHLVHWSIDHLIWDLVAFFALSTAAIALAPGRVVPCLFFSALMIPLEISWLRPELMSYRGLSGLDAALFGLVLSILWQGNKTEKALSGVAFAGFFAKVIYELVTGDTWFVNRSEGDFIPAVSAHLVGGACGWICGVVSPRCFVKKSDPGRRRGGRISRSARR